MAKVGGLGKNFRKVWSAQPGQRSIMRIYMTVDQQTKKTLRIIILTTCFGVIGRLIFNNGFMLTYLSRLGFPSYRILFLLSLLPLAGLVLTLPFAYLSDRFGKKRIGIGGTIIALFGLLLLTSAGFFKEQGGRVAITGILIFSIGSSAIASNWFALLSPIIPEDIRGRFFGKLRISWQTTGIVFTLAVTTLLGLFTKIQFFQHVLLFVLICSMIRIYLYWQIPELETTRTPPRGLLAPFLEILRIPGYLPFCAYTFLLALFTGAIPWVIGLLGKDILLFSDANILFMSNFGAVGAVAGFYLGGKMVDRWGTKPVFLTCHFGFATVLFLIVLRDLFPFPAIATLSLLSALFGTTIAASGIAFSSELLALVPSENKSLSTGFHLSLFSAGIALSSLLIGQALKLNVLNPEWTLMGQTLCAYDTILLSSAVMILLLIITLGLIPSVIQVRKAQWYPQNK